MRIKEVSLEGFRNFGAVTLTPSETVNIIYGDNAQGKTNLLEALWLCTGEKSFRGAKESQMLGFERENAAIRMRYENREREMEIEIRLGEKKEVSLNGVALRSLSGLIGEFYAVIFSPDHLSLVKEGPSMRRKFIDAAICQIKPSYVKLLSDYNRIVTQRNSVLKDAAYHSFLLDTLDIWDNYLLRVGAAVVRTRKKYCEKLGYYAGGFYRGISGEKENLSIEYLYAGERCGALEENEEKRLGQELRENRAEDLRTAVTSVGPHRDDIAFNIDGRSARLYGSQGQQRSCVLALKLSEGSIIKAVTGEEPVVLFDDVMSELDHTRTNYILNHLQERQIFITCCDKAAFRSVQKGKSFEIQKGSLLSEGEF